MGRCNSGGRIVRGGFSMVEKLYERGSNVKNWQNNQRCNTDDNVVLP